jgi:hypothetical protein
MSCRVFEKIGHRGPAKTTILMAVVFFLSVCASESFAQKRFSRVYPAGQDIRLVLINKTGTVTVEGWNRQEVSINAAMEAPAATIAPQSLSGVIDINLLRDNQGRDTGNVNFLIKVPFNSKVDIETRIGKIKLHVAAQY